MFYSLLVLLFLFIPSSRCQTNLTYVFSHVNSSLIEFYLQSNGWYLTNTSYVKRLSTVGMDFLNSTELILTANDIQSIVVNWNTGYCSFSEALAEKYSWINVSNPLCFTGVSLTISNLLQLTITMEQLASSASIFMKFYSLTYFSIITSLSNEFYFNLAQEFSIHLTKDAFILEQFLFPTSFSSTSISSRSKGQSTSLLPIHQQSILFIF